MNLPRIYIPMAPALVRASIPVSQARFAIQSAAAKEQTAELHELLKKFPRRAKDALYWAAANGHQETVAALMLDTRPTMKALRAAKSNSHQPIVRMIERRYTEILRQPDYTL